MTHAAASPLAARQRHDHPSAIGLSALFVLMFSGCGAMHLHLTPRVDLTKTQVSSMQAWLPGGPEIAPGQKLPLAVKFTQPDGTVLYTEGKGGGRVEWRDLSVSAKLVTVDNKGVVHAPTDPRMTDAKVGRVEITVPSHPELHTEVDVPFRYDVKYSADFSGRTGSDGFSGMNGTDGMSGTTGSFDPSHPEPGGNGSNGSSGTSGGNGSDGGNAPPVDILVTRHPGVMPLLEVSVSAPGREQRLYLIDAQGGSLFVSADGGAGGAAGKGGKGGKGGRGGLGSPNGSDGMDGSNGMDGIAGSSGRGGLITVTYDPQVQPYLLVLHLRNLNGPKPVYREAPVAPLW